MYEIFTCQKPYILFSSEYISQYKIFSNIINGLRPSIPSELWMNGDSKDEATHIEEFFLKSNDLSNIDAMTNIVEIVRMYFDLCVHCWANNSSERPSFHHIVAKLQEIEALLKI
jgi:hypothetical protein